MEWTLEQLVDAQIDYRLAGHYTALLCIVTQVRDLEEARVDVQPLINKQYKDGEVQEYPAILSVPVLFPCSSVGGVVFPIVQGDTVLVVFNKSNIDVFKAGATTPHDPIDERSFNIRDAVAIPCVFPFSKTPNKNKTVAYSKDDVIITNNIGTAQESEIRINKTGGITLTSPTTVNVVCPNVAFSGNLAVTGNIAITGNLAVTGTGLYTGISTFNGALISTTTTTLTGTATLNGLAISTS